MKREIDYWTKKDANKRLILSLDYPDDVDKELIPLLDVINSIPGVRTMFSCCGHGNCDFYMTFAFTSIEAKSMICQLFSGLKKIDITKLGFKNEDYIDIFPHAEFTFDDFWLNQWSFITEITMGVYSNQLGSKDEKERIKDYKRMCRFLMKFVPYKHW